MPKSSMKLSRIMEYKTSIWLGALEMAGGPSPTGNSISYQNNLKKIGMQAQIQSHIYTFIYIRIFTSEE